MNALAALRRRQDYVPTDVATGRVADHVVTGSLWAGVGVLATAVLQFIRSMIFARLLMPADFGVISLANVFTQFILLFANFGFTASIIYQRGLTRKDLATVWWGSLAVDGAAALACVVFAFASHRFLNNPQVPAIICLLSIQFMMVSVGSINGALMRRQFRFKQTALVNIWGSVATFAAAYVGVRAFHGGVYGLVGGVLFGTAVMTLLNFLYLPWLPSRFFSWAVLKEHVSYGRWFLGVTLVTYSNENVDRLLIGTRLGNTALGYYDYAANLPMQIVLQLGTVLNTVLFPAFANLQHDFAELRRVLLRVMRYNMLIIYPLLVGLAIVAPDFVTVAYGAKWAPIILPTRIFCVFGLVRVLINPYYSLCNGVGRPALPFKWSAIALPLNLALLVLGVTWGKLDGITLAKLFLPTFVFVTLGTEIMRHIGLPLRELGAASQPAAACCLVMAAVVLLVRATLGPSLGSPLSRLLAEVSAGGLAYVAALRLMWRTEFQGLLSVAARLRQTV